MMGLGNPSSMDSNDRLPCFEYYTPLLLDMRICKEYLRKPYSYFKSLSRYDRTLLRLFEEWERRKGLDEEKKIRAEMNVNRNRNSGSR